MPETTTIIEVASFQRRARRLFTAQELASLRLRLSANPTLGDMVRGTGGCRKVRFTGRRGASRVIHYYHAGDGTVYLILAYLKSDQEDLTARQKRLLREIASEIKINVRKKRRGEPRDA